LGYLPRAWVDDASPAAGEVCGSTVSFWAAAWSATTPSTRYSWRKRCWTTRSMPTLSVDRWPGNSAGGCSAFPPESVSLPSEPVSSCRADGVDRFANALGLEDGVTGYVYHTVPVAIYAWLRHRHAFDEAVIAALTLGGDTDTVDAIVGAMAGSTAGVTGIPERWLAGLAEWPRTPALLGKVADRLVRQREAPVPLGRVRYFWPGVIPRNVAFTAVVLVHGLRRLVPG
jgi:hypothetical protein